MAAPDIYAFLDYRSFCREFYKFQKANNPNFSFRFFAKKAAVAGSYLKHVIDGNRNVSPEMSLKFARGMDLNSKETDYFENLVRFNQATTLEEKTLYFERLRRKRSKALRPLGMTEAVDLLSHWYVIAIKELVVSVNSDDPRLIQKVMRKKLPETLIQKTIEKLKSLAWIHQVDGRWSSSASQVQFPDEVKSYVVRSFHRQMLELSIEALEDDLSEREYGAATFTFPAVQLPQLKEKVKELQRELVSYVQYIGANSEDSDLRLVYHFGVQCFALQRHNAKEGSDE